MLPNFQEDESTLREILENLGSSPFAKRHVRIVLATEAREDAMHCIVRWTKSCTHPFPNLRRRPLTILAALVRQRNTCLLCWPFETCEERGFKHSRQSRTSHGGNWPPPLRTRLPTLKNLAALLQQQEHRRRSARVRTLKIEPCISQQRLATTSSTWCCCTGDR